MYKEHSITYILMWVRQILLPNSRLVCHEHLKYCFASTVSYFSKDVLLSPQPFHPNGFLGRWDPCMTSPHDPSWLAQVWIHHLSWAKWSLSQECFWTKTEKVGHTFVLAEDIIWKNDEQLLALFNILWSKLKIMMQTSEMRDMISEWHSNSWPQLLGRTNCFTED